MNSRHQRRRIERLKRRRWTFHDETLDEFERCEAMRIAGADSDEAARRDRGGDYAVAHDAARG
jgi:hypothetical protein